MRNCNLLAGLGFYALLPVGTVLFAAPAGVLAGLAFPRRGRLVAFLLPLVSVLWTLARLYADPAVFAFDPFGGYFPGPIYDEALRPPLRLLVLPAGQPGLDRHRGHGRGGGRRPRVATRGAGAARRW